MSDNWIQKAIGGAINVASSGVTGLIEPAVGYFRDRQQAKHEERVQKRELEAEKHRLRMDRVRQGMVAEVDWNKAHSGAASWTDDYLTIILSIPLVLAFFPPAVPYLREGFQVLETMPAWYQSAIAVMIAAAFGYKKYADHQMRKAYTLPTIGQPGRDRGGRQADQSKTD